jgi:hypothetical protein
VISNTRFEMETRVQRAGRPYVVALTLFALLVAVASLLTIGQALVRRLVLDAAENPTLRALGMTTSHLGMVALARAGLVAVGGATLAVAVAVPGSGIMPIGPARLAEPTPGISVDGAVLGVGFVAIVVLVVAGASVPAERSGRRRSLVAELLGRAGLGPTSVCGVRMALESGQGRTAVPVRSALVGAALAVAAVLAASTYAASLSRLISTPRLHGQDWDLAIDSSWGFLAREQVVGVLGPNRSVAAFSAGIDAQLLIDGVSVPAVGLQDLKGSAVPSIVAGRPAATADEIVLGSRTLRRLHRAVGDVVAVGAGQDARPMRVVGRAVFPAIGRIEAAPTGLGTGAALTLDGLKAVAPGSPPIGFNLVLVRLAPGADRTAVQRQLDDDPRLGRRSSSLPARSRPSPTSGPPTLSPSPLDASGTGRFAGCPHRHDLRAHARNSGPAPPPRPSCAQGARLPAVADLCDGRLAGQRTGSPERAGRPTSRPRRWALGMASLRQPAWRRGRTTAADGGSGARPASGAVGGQPHRRRSGRDGYSDPLGPRTSLRVTSPGSRRQYLLGFARSEDDEVHPVLADRYGPARHRRSGVGDGGTRDLRAYPGREQAPATRRCSRRSDESSNLSNEPATRGGLL